MKIRAAVLHEFTTERPFARSRPLRIEEVDLAPPGSGEVLVRVRAANLCHSDLSVIDGTRPRPTPMVIGHEASGVVEVVGPGVTDLAPGDHVVMVFVPSCGRCPRCAEGRPALCEPGNQANVDGRLLSKERRLSLGGSPVNHHSGISAFAERAVVSSCSVVKVDPELPFELGALFGCAVVTGVGAAFNTARVRPGDSVAVVGLGGVGLSALLGTIACGATQVIAVDVAQEKLELARSLGATAVFNAASPTAADDIRAASRGGVDHALEMAGSVKALDLAFQITRRGGQTTTAGLAHHTHTFPLPPVKLVAEERTLKGSYMGSCIPSADIPRFIDLFRAGRLPVDRLLTSTGALDDINAGFDALADGRTIRHVVRM